MDGRPGAEARAAARAAADGLAGRVRDEERQLRRRGLGRLLPDARRDLEPGRLRGLPDKPELQVKWFLDNAEASRRRGSPRASRSRPEPLRRLDRRRRAPGRAVPRPLPDQARPRPRSCSRAGPAAPAAVPVAGRGRRSGGGVSAGGGGSALGAAALQIAQSQKGVRETGDRTPARRSTSTSPRPRSRRGTPGARRSSPGRWRRPGTRCRAAAGPGSRPGCATPSRTPTASSSSAPRTRGPETSSPTTGAARTTSAPTATSASSTATSRTASSPRSRATTPTRSRRPAPIGGGANIVFIRVEGNAPPAPRRSPAPRSTPRAAAPAAASHADRPHAVRRRGHRHGGAAGAEALALLEQQEHRVRLRRRRRHQGRPDRPARDRRADEAQPASTRSRSRACAPTTRSSPRAARSPTTSSAAAWTSRAIDGEIVGPGSPLAREVACELSSLNPDYRPNEIGSPFAIAGPGYFTDAAHQNHIHVGFKQEIPADWKPPTDVASAAPATAAAVPGAPVAAAAAVPGAPAAAAPPRPRKGSQMFLQAVTATGRRRRRQAVSRATTRWLPEGRRAAEGERRRRRPRRRAARRRRSGRPGRRRRARRRRRGRRGRRRRRRRGARRLPRRHAPREQIAAWMAGQAQKRGLPPQLPLMASLVESGHEEPPLRRRRLGRLLPDARRDLEPGRLRRLPREPELQVKWFLDQAEAVKRQRLVAGKSITDPNQFGDWIADVERPAEQYRGRYQLKLDEANGLLARRPRSPPPRPSPRPPCRSIPPPPPRAPPRSATRSCPPRSSPRSSRRSPRATPPGRRRWPRSRRPRSTSAPTTSGAARRRRRASTAPGLMQWAYAQSGVQIPRVTYTQIEARQRRRGRDRRT